MDIKSRSVAPTNARSVTMSRGDRARTFIVNCRDINALLERDNPSSLSSIEYLLLSLCSCSIGTVINGLAKEGIEIEGLKISASAQLNEFGNYYENFKVNLHFDHQTSEEHVVRAKELAKGCLMHRTLARHPIIEVVHSHRQIE